MNNIRRKQLAAIMERLEELKSDIELVLEEEQEAMDNVPESLWGSERYERMEEAVSNMEEAVSGLEDVISSIECAVE